MNVAMMLCMVQAIPLLCPRGRYADEPTVDVHCKDCPAGKFRDTIWWTDPCTQCPNGTDSGPGSSACVDVPVVTLNTEDEDDSSAWTTGGIGVAAGASVGVVYYASTT